MLQITIQMQKGTLALCCSSKSPSNTPYFEYKFLICIDNEGVMPRISV